MTVRALVRLLPLALLLGAATAILVSCGSSGAGLIPAQNAGPLESAFQAVAQAAQEGNGSCTPTESALHTAENEFRALPRSVDAGLRGRIEEGLTNLRGRALALCAEPLGQTTTGASTTTTKTTAPPTETTGTATQTTPTTATQTTPTTGTTGTGAVPTTPQPSGPGGGTPAPGVGGSSEGQDGEGQSGEGAAGEGDPGGAGASGGTNGGSGQ